MYHIKTVFCSGIAALALLGLVSCASVAKEGKEGLVIQVSDGSPATWNLALNIAEQAPENYAAPLSVEIVAFGAGLNLLKYDSEVGSRLKKAFAKGVALRACGVTMGKAKLTEKDLYPEAGIRVVHAGAVEVMEKQKQGWYYIRP